MTKKHFEALAREIAKIEDQAARESAALAVVRAVAEFNDRFNVGRFLRACNVPEK